ncbi:MAG: hypothetical protein HN353_01315 [Bdellovibrionales bacterium]|jgi:hypothetical protein|nr:hypothetical protein [Bdellovibrionales bacterium]MBT3526692.1 hypothetical protein [Bdellovibrionales bacterium]MBT7668460.1 hypothetical protein [Bdellovibrionales bacterium]
MKKNLNMLTVYLLGSLVLMTSCGPKMSEKDLSQSKKVLYAKSYKGATPEIVDIKFEVKEEVPLEPEELVMLKKFRDAGADVDVYRFKVNVTLIAKEDLFATGYKDSFKKESDRDSYIKSELDRRTNKKKCIKRSRGAFGGSGYCKKYKTVKVKDAADIEKKFRDSLKKQKVFKKGEVVASGLVGLEIQNKNNETTVVLKENT